MCQHIGGAEQSFHCRHNDAIWTGFKISFDLIGNCPTRSAGSMTTSSSVVPLYGQYYSGPFATIEQFTSAIEVLWKRRSHHKTSLETDNDGRWIWVFCQRPINVNISQKTIFAMHRSLSMSNRLPVAGKQAAIIQTASSKIGACHVRSVPIQTFDVRLGKCVMFSSLVRMTGDQFVIYVVVQ